MYDFSTWDTIFSLCHTFEEQGAPTDQERLAFRYELQRVRPEQKSSKCPEASWSKAFGEVRSILSKEDLSDVDRAKLLVLIYGASQRAPERYKAEWATHVRRHRAAKLLEESWLIEEKFRRKRRGGTVLAHLTPKKRWDDTSQVLLRLFQEYGIGGMVTEHWSEHPETQARHQFFHMLGRCAVYGHDIMKDEDVQSLKKRFLSPFDGELTWFVPAGRPIPQATFCRGVACMDAHTAGFLILWEED